MTKRMVLMLLIAGLIFGGVFCFLLSKSPIINKFLP